jgi:hypothetical protein
VVERRQGRNGCESGGDERGERAKEESREDKRKRAGEESKGTARVE